MEPIRKIFQNVSTSLTIDLPAEYKSTDVEVIVWPLPQEEEKTLNTDLSDFFGKMKWEGDALAEQKKLRDEWD